MSRGLSPRSVARAVACRPRLLSLPGARRRLERRSGRRPAARRAPGRPADVPVARGSRSAARRSPTSPRRAACATGRSSSCSTPPVCGSPSCCRCAPATCTSTQGYLTCIGKGDKQRIVPLGDAGGRWVRRYCARARPALLRRSASRPWLFVNASGGGRLSRVGFWKLLKRYGVKAGVPRASQPARAAAFVRDAPARARRGSARDPDDARPRRSLDHADLHARARGAAARRLRPVPPAA